MSIVTLTTDFGTEDGNVGVMKGIILGINPEARIIDISHQIGPQNIRQAAFVLARQIFFFPPETVHVVVVDPGVGTARRPIAARAGSQLLVGPDNGVFTPLYERAEREGWPLEVVDLNQPQYWRDEISHVFHGRDIFSPVGAHLAKGTGLSEVGQRIDDAVQISFAAPQWNGDVLHGEISHIDHFGNMFVNIEADMLAGREVLVVQVGSTVIEGMVNAFGEQEAGLVVALYSSTNELLIAQVNGSAAAATGAKIGDSVTVRTGN